MPVLVIPPLRPLFANGLCNDSSLDVAVERILVVLNLTLHAVVIAAPQESKNDLQAIVVAFCIRLNYIMQDYCDMIERNVTRAEAPGVTSARKKALMEDCSANRRQIAVRRIFSTSGRSAGLMIRARIGLGQRVGRRRNQCGILLFCAYRRRQPL